MPESIGAPPLAGARPSFIRRSPWMTKQVAPLRSTLIVYEARLPDKGKPVSGLSRRQVSVGDLGRESAGTPWAPAQTVV